MSALLRAAIVVLLLGTTANAELVSYDTSQWDHGSGPQVGWVDGEFSGTTTVLGNITLDVTSSQNGTAQYTADHASRIDETFFTGFAFQALPSTTVNTGVALTNYVRLDFSFSSPVNVVNYTLTDVDRTDGQWYDVIAAEAFTTTAPGAVGAGIDPVYSTNTPSNIGFGTIHGLAVSGPLNNTGNVQNTPENDIGIAFAEPVRSFSIYYWNLGTADSGATTQTIGTRDNLFEISAVPSSVPEPSAVALVMLGFCVIQSRRRRILPG